METQDMDQLMAFRLTPKLVTALKKAAAKRHCSMSAIVRQALLHELARGGMPDQIKEAIKELMDDAVGRAAAKLKRVG